MPTFDYSGLSTEISVRLRERSYTIEEPSTRLLARMARLAGAAPGELEQAAGTLEEILRELVPGISESDLRFLMIPRVLGKFLRDLAGANREGSGAVPEEAPARGKSPWG